MMFNLSWRVHRLDTLLSVCLNIVFIEIAKK